MDAGGADQAAHLAMDKGGIAALGLRAGDRAMAGAMVRKYTGRSRVCASLKVRAVAPRATKAAAKRSAAGKMTRLPGLLQTEGQKASSRI